MKAKAVTSSLIISGLLLGGFGTAQIVSAQTADDDDTAVDNETDANTETDTDTESDEDADGTRADRRGDRDGTRSEGRKGGGGCNQEALADAIGISVDELSAAREEGASLAEIAEANGVDPDVVAEVLIADVNAKLDAKVAEGDLTEEEAAERLAEKSERIEDRIFGDDDADDADETDDAEETDEDEEEIGS